MSGLIGIHQIRDAGVYIVHLDHYLLSPAPNFRGIYYSKYYGRGGGGKDEEGEKGKRGKKFGGKLHKRP